MTALHWAARNNDVATARALVRAGASVKAATRYGVTPLTLAAQNGSAPMLDLLLKAGGDANATMPQGRDGADDRGAHRRVPTPSRCWPRTAPTSTPARGWMGESALTWAAAENHADAVRALRRARRRRQPQVEGAAVPRVQVDDVGDGEHGAAARRLDAADARGASGFAGGARRRWLAAPGVDLNVTDPDGTTALVVAIINAHYDVAAAILEQGADPNMADSHRHDRALRARGHAHAGADAGPARAEAGGHDRRRSAAQAAGREGRQSQRAAAAADARAVSRVGRRAAWARARRRSCARPRPWTCR